MNLNGIVSAILSVIGFCIVIGLIAHFIPGVNIAQIISDGFSTLKGAFQSIF